MNKRIIGKYSGLTGWQDRVQTIYKTFEEFEAYADTYGLHERYKCAPHGKRTLQDIWDQNLHIEGSVEPKDACVGEVYALDKSTERITVINPGDYFGKAYVIGIQCGYNADLFIVEADNESDAVDEFVDSKFGHLCHIPEDAFGDYDMGLDGEEAPEWATWRDLTGKYRTGEPPGEVPHYGGNCGEPCDLDDMSINDMPKCIKYFGPFIPQSGLTPEQYSDWGNVADSTRAIIEQLSVEYIREDADIMALTEQIEEYSEVQLAMERQRIRERDESLYGTSPMKLAMLLCRTYYPDSDDEIMTTVSKDEIEAQAKLAIESAVGLHSGQGHVMYDDVTVDGKPARAVAFCIWNRELKQLDRHPAIPESSTRTMRLSFECGLRRMVKLSHPAIPDGETVTRIIIDEFTTK